MGHRRAADWGWRSASPSPLPTIGGDGRAAGRRPASCTLPPSCFPRGVLFLLLSPVLFVPACLLRRVQPANALPVHLAEYASAITGTTVASADCPLLARPVAGEAWWPPICLLPGRSGVPPSPGYDLLAAVWMFGVAAVIYGLSAFWLDESNIALRSLAYWYNTRAGVNWLTYGCRASHSLNQPRLVRDFPRGADRLVRGDAPDAREQYTRGNLSGTNLQCGLPKG